MVRRLLGAALTWLLAGLLAVGLLAGVAPSAAADTPVVTLRGDAHRYFHPVDGVSYGYDARITVNYCLSASVVVTVVVTDADDAVVRTLVDGQRQGPVCSYENGADVSWDGHDDAGRVVPDGAYTVTVTAVGDDGATGTAGVDTGVDTRDPGQLTAPAAGSTLTGTVDWAFTPTAGFGLDSVELRCDRQTIGTATAPDDAGIYGGTADTTRCATDTRELFPYVSWHDAYGTAHSWSGPAVAVQLDNGLRVNLAAGGRHYISPNGDGSEDALEVGYCLTAAGTVDVLVTDAAGSTVRTIERGVDRAATECPAYAFTTSWDGRDDAGAVVADGVYALVVRATDAAGTTAEASVDVGVDTRIPGRLTTPGEGDSISGSFAWSFTPTDGFPVRKVTLYCNRGTRSLGVAEQAEADGTFRGTADTAGCGSGAGELLAYAFWVDPFTSWHETLSRLPVVFGNPPTVTVAPSQAYFSPNGDGFEDTRSVVFCTQGTGTVTPTIRNGSGDLVATLTAVEVDSREIDCASTEWNGRDDDGAVVPDGPYTMTLRVVGRDGLSAEATTQLGVDTQPLGTLLEPARGAHLVGTVDVTFEPRPDTPIRSVAVGLGDGAPTEIRDASPDGRWRTTLEVGDRPDGPTVITVHVLYDDPTGSVHTWTGPSTPVIIGAAPNAPLAVTTTALPRGVVGKPYSATLAATGGTAPYVWAVTGGRLPTGLRLDPATGVISGTPKVARRSKITVTALDAADPAGSDQARFTLLVAWPWPRR